MSAQPTQMARFQVVATGGGRRDRRVVWATDIGTALIVARDVRGWGSDACRAKRVSEWVQVVSVDGGMGHAATDIQSKDSG